MFTLDSRKKVSILLAAAMVFSLAFGPFFYVGAAEDNSWELSSFVTNVAVRDRDGNMVEDGVFYFGSAYTFVIEFAEGLGSGKMQFGYNDEGFLVYRLPDEIVIERPVSNGVITVAGNKTIGWYDISGAGLVEVRFGNYNNQGDDAFDEYGLPQNFIDHYTDACFTLNVTAQFEHGAQSGEVLFGADSSVFVSMLKYPDPEITVGKTSSGYDIATETIGYTVTITAHGDLSLSEEEYARETQKITAIKLSDMPFTSQNSAGAARQNTDKDFSPAFSGVMYRVGTGGTEGQWTDISGHVIWRPGAAGERNRFEYDFAELALYPGDTITLVYELDVPVFLGILRDHGIVVDQLNQNFFIGNDVAVDSSAGSVTAEKRDNVHRTFHLEKEGVLAADTLHEGMRKIEWTATIGDETSGKLNGRIISDRIKQHNRDIVLPGSSDISISLYGLSEGLLVPAGTFTASEFGAGFIRSNDYNFAFTVPGAGERVGGVELPEIHRVVISYATGGVPGETDETPAKVYINDIHYSDLLSASGSVFIPQYPITHSQPDPAINKATSHVRETEPGSGEYVIDYTIMFTVPAGTIDHSDGWKGRNIYFHDAMTLSGAGPGLTLDLSGFDTDGVSVDLYYPEPDFAYTVYINRDTLNICFGGWDIYSPANSRWQYDEEKTVTVRYTLPLSIGTASGISIYDWIRGRSQNNEGLWVLSYLRNNAVITYQGWQSGGSKNADTYDYWPISKSAAVSAFDDSVFEYTVILNPDPSVSISSNSRFSLFRSNNPARFTDTFDDRMEFVPGSLYVRDAGTAIYYGPYSGTTGSIISGVNQSDAITVADGSITVDLSRLTRLVRNGAALSISSGAPGNWYTNANYFEICYRLRLKDPNGPDNTILTNTAVIYSTTQDSFFSGETSVEYIKKPLSKEMTADGSNIAGVEIIINPHGRVLRPEGADSDRFVAIDKMDGDLVVFLSSIKVYTQSMESEGGWDGVWVQKEISPVREELWSFTSVSPQEVHFILPDETPVRIVYMALVTAPVGGQAAFRNSISVYGYSKMSSNNNYRVTGTSASAEAYKSDVLVYKADAADESVRLDGAAFKLYMSLDGYVDPQAEMVTIRGRDFYCIAQSTAGGGGEYKLSSPGITPAHRAVYLIAETQAPEGYWLPVAPGNYTCFIIDARSEADIRALERELGVGVGLIADNIHITNSTFRPPDGGGGEGPPPDGGNGGGGTTPGGGGDPERPPDGETPPNGGGEGTPPAGGGLDPNSPAAPGGPGGEPEPGRDGWSEYGEDGVPAGEWGSEEDGEVMSFEEYTPPPEMPRTGLSDMRKLWLSAMGVSILSFVILGYITYREKRAGGDDERETD